MEPTRGAQLANQLLQAFESMAREVRTDLAERGHDGATTTHHYAMEAIDRGATDASALGRALGVSRQAAAKTIRSLEQMGYVERGADSSDARRRPLEVTARGHEMTALGAAAYERIRSRLEEREGVARLTTTEQVLRSITGDDPNDARVCPGSGEQIRAAISALRPGGGNPGHGRDRGGVTRSRRRGQSGS